MIVKHIIRSSQRKNRDERQHNLTKYFNLQPSVKSTKPTQPDSITKQRILRQTPMNQFLSKMSTSRHLPPGPNVNSFIGSGKNPALPNWNNIVYPRCPNQHKIGTIPNVRPPMKNKNIQQSQ